MRARVRGFGVDCRWPALEILPRWKPRGLGEVYGESAKCSVLLIATWVNGWLGDGVKLGAASHFWRLLGCFVITLRHSNILGATGRKAAPGLKILRFRLQILRFDGRFVMLPATLVERASKAVAHGERSL